MLPFIQKKKKLFRPLCLNIPGLGSKHDVHSYTANGTLGTFCPPTQTTINSTTTPVNSKYLWVCQIQHEAELSAIFTTECYVSYTRTHLEEFTTQACGNITVNIFAAFDTCAVNKKIYPQKQG